MLLHCWYIAVTATVAAGSAATTVVACCCTAVCKVEDSEAPLSKLALCWSCGKTPVAVTHVAMPLLLLLLP